MAALKVGSALMVTTLTRPWRWERWDVSSSARCKH